MTRAAEGIRVFTHDDVATWHRAQGRRIFLGDVVDASNSDAMSVGFARYAPGESNEWVVTYDEALIVTRGAFSVTSADGIKTTANAGEVIVLSKGTKVVYSAEDAGANVVYVTYPHWIDAQRRSEHAALLDSFHPVAADAEPRQNEAATADNVALLREIWEPIARGESDDNRPFFDALAENVVFKLPVGELRGKQAVIDYLANAAETIEFQPFDRPLEYYGAGDRVVIVGVETFRVKQTGATHRAEWAWVHDMRDGKITRIVAIQDLTGVAEDIRDVILKVQSTA
ncbi:MAG: nuclear transport factor 2 family protein [Solirubrobacteraceae bacterium]